MAQQPLQPVAMTGAPEPLFDRDRREHHPPVVLGSLVQPEWDLGHARVGTSNFYNHEDVLSAKA
jgi:hypothetical protein